MPVTARRRPESSGLDKSFPQGENDNPTPLLSGFRRHNKLAQPSIVSPAACRSAW